MGEPCPEEGPTHKWGGAEAKTSLQILPWSIPGPGTSLFMVLNVEGGRGGHHLHPQGRGWNLPIVPTPPSLVPLLGPPSPSPSVILPPH